MKLAPFLLLLLFFAIPAHAEDVPLVCDAPIQYEDNTAIPAGTVITFNVYSAAKGQPKKLVTPTPIAACSSLRTNVGPGNWCWDATAIIAGVESEHAAEYCKVIAAPKPKSPTNVRTAP